MCKLVCESVPRAVASVASIIGSLRKTRSLPLAVLIHISTGVFRKRAWATIFLASSLLSVFTQAAADQAPSDKPNLRTIELWPNGAPGATGARDEDKPAVIPFLPAEGQHTGAAVLICPGGAF